MLKRDEFDFRVGLCNSFNRLIIRTIVYHNNFKFLIRLIVDSLNRLEDVFFSIPSDHHHAYKNRAQFVIHEVAFPN